MTLSRSRTEKAEQQVQDLKPRQPLPQLGNSLYGEQQRGNSHWGKSQSPGLQGCPALSQRRGGRPKSQAREMLKEGSGTRAEAGTVWAQRMSQGSGPLSRLCLQVSLDTMLNLSEPQCPHLESKWAKPEEWLSPSPRKRAPAGVLLNLPHDRDEEPTASSW